MITDAAAHSQVLAKDVGEEAARLQPHYEEMEPHHEKIINEQCFSKKRNRLRCLETPQKMEGNPIIVRKFVAVSAFAKKASV